jgi:hypothetical protein
MMVDREATFILVTWAAMVVMWLLLFLRWYWHLLLNHFLWLNLLWSLLHIVFRVEPLIDILEDNITCPQGIHSNGEA